MRISDWSSDVCSSDLEGRPRQPTPHRYWRHHSLEWECRRLHVRPQFPHPHEYGCGHPSLGRPTSLCSPLPLRLQQLYYCSPRLTKRRHPRSHGKNGRASCRERVCTSDEFSVVAVPV